MKRAFICCTLVALLGLTGCVYHDNDRHHHRHHGDYHGDNGHRGNHHHR